MSELRKAIVEYLAAQDAINGAHEARLAVGTDWTALNNRMFAAGARLTELLTEVEEDAATPAAPEARPSSQINSAEDAQALASGATEQRETDDHRRLSAEDARVLRREKE